MVPIIVLAAGKSVRMRGENKLLLEIQGVPMIRRVVQAALESRVDEVIAVLGWQEERIRHALSGLRFRPVVNANYEVGQSSSVRTGLAAVHPAARAALILPGDVALVDAAAINTVIAKYDESKCKIVIASHLGKQGHPILFDRQLFSEIQRIDEATFGLKAVVKNHEREVCMIETGSENVLKDVDTPEDLKTL
jgi:molybdenum cofactor cytidylyltransferase